MAILIILWFLVYLLLFGSLLNFLIINAMLSSPALERQKLNLKKDIQIKVKKEAFLMAGDSIKWAAQTIFGKYWDG